MAFLNINFDSIKEKATDLAQSGVNKSKQVAEFTKLKMSNMAEEDNIKKAYQEIGKLYFAEHGGTPEGPYIAACEKVNAAKAVIAANEARLADLNSSDMTDEDVAEAEAETSQESQPAQEPAEEAVSPEEPKE